MEPATALLLLVVCSPDLLLCREMTAVELRYESIETCEIQEPTQLARFTQNGFRAFGKCVDYGEKVYRKGQSSNWNISVNGNLTAYFGTTEIAAMTMPRAKEDSVTLLPPKSSRTMGVVNVARYDSGAKMTVTYDVTGASIYKLNR